MSGGDRTTSASPRNTSFAQENSFLGATGSFRKMSPSYGASFRTGAQRRIGVAKTAAFSDFRMSGENDVDQDDEGSEIPVTTSVASNNPPSPYPNNSEDGALMAQSTTDYSDIDLNSQGGRSMTRGRGRAGYGSFELSVEPYRSMRGHEDLSDVGTTARRVTSRFSNPWTASFESAFFSFIIILSTSVARGNLNETAVAGIVSLTAVLGFGFCVSYGTFLEAARGEKWSSHYSNLDERLETQGWSVESIEAYKSDIRPKMQRPTVGDLVWASVVHISGALLPVMPVVIGELADWRLVPTMITSSSFTLSYCILIRSYQVSCAPQHAFTGATAFISLVGVAFVSGIMVAVGHFFHEVR